MKTLNFVCRGEWWKVNAQGQLCRSTEDTGYWKDNWKFLGVSKHHWANNIQVKFGIDRDPKDYIGGLVWDLDHGTTRQWGGHYNGKLPRITSAYITE